MLEEEKTGEETGAADQTTGDTGQAGGQADGSQAAAEQGTREVEGLKAAATAERAKRQEAEADATALKAQLAVINANYAQPQNAAKQKSLYVSIAEHLRIDPEYPTPEENGRIMETMLQMSNAQAQQQSFIASHPDYSQVVGTSMPNGGFQMAPPLQRVINNNPALASKIAGLDPAVAYQLAVTDPQYQKEVADKAKPENIKASEKAEEAIKTAAAKASISVASGGGSTSKTAEIAGWTDEQVHANVEKAKSQV